MERNSETLLKSKVKIKTIQGALNIIHFIKLPKPPLISSGLTSSLMFLCTVLVLQILYPEAIWFLSVTNVLCGTRQ